MRSSSLVEGLRGGGLEWGKAEACGGQWVPGKPSRRVAGGAGWARAAPGPGLLLKEETEPQLPGGPPHPGALRRPAARSGLGHM